LSIVNVQIYLPVTDRVLLVTLPAIVLLLTPTAMVPLVTRSSSSPTLAGRPGRIALAHGLLGTMIFLARSPATIELVEPDDTERVIALAQGMANLLSRLGELGDLSELTVRAEMVLLEICSIPMEVEFERAGSGASGAGAAAVTGVP
jgi:hypothetical protein